MENLKIYNGAFLKLFSIDNEELESLKYQSIDSWDSVGHMALIAEIEEKFNIEMDIDDIIEFSDYKKERNSKYNRNFIKMPINEISKNLNYDINQI